MGSLTISQEDAIALLENLPDDLDPARKAVVETAVQLVGRVSYFWGGKSLTLGWDDRWGVPTEVTAAGSGSIGTVRPFGLDCSGFVDWTSTMRRTAATIPDAAVVRRHSTAIARISHGAMRSRATLCSILTIPTSVSLAVKTQTAIS